MPPAKKRTALIVDDDSTLRYVLGRLARLAGFEILEANNSSVAMELATANVPDVVVADVRLPHYDGFELCKRLKSDRATKPIPVVLVTSMYYQSSKNPGSVAEGKKKAREAGAIDLLPRGEALDALGSMLTGLMAGSNRKRPSKRR